MGISCKREKRKKKKEKEEKVYVFVVETNVKNGDYYNWFPCSPDISPCENFLWRYLKAQTFRRWPQTVEGLKDCIRH